MESYKYTFKITTGKNGRTFERTHYCHNDKEALCEARGMVYAFFFLYKYPTVEVWRDGKMLTGVR